MKKDSLELVQANDDDFMNIYGYIPKEKYVAYKGLINNNFVGIGGYVLNQNNATLFLNIQCKQYKIIILRALIKKLSKIRKTGLVLNVIRDKEEINSDMFLQKLGFTLSYISNDDEVWELINESNTI
jgi:hypothetical protein